MLPNEIDLTQDAGYVAAQAAYEAAASTFGAQSGQAVDAAKLLLIAMDAAVVALTGN